MSIVRQSPLSPKDAGDFVRRDLCQDDDTHSKTTVKKRMLELEQRIMTILDLATMHLLGTLLDVSSAISVGPG
jgi:hypothetical protein